MTTPLAGDGSNYPCKVRTHSHRPVLSLTPRYDRVTRHQRKSRLSIPSRRFRQAPNSAYALSITLGGIALTTLQLNMTGSATHGGGSCQFALSYDESVCALIRGTRSVLTRFVAAVNHSPSSRVSSAVALSLDPTLSTSLKKSLAEKRFCSCGLGSVSLASILSFVV